MSYKKVIACTNITTNFLCHLLAVARVVFDSDYAERYVDTIPEDDKATLQQYGDLIAFGGGSSGDLADIMMGLPMMAGLSTSEAFREYFSDLDHIAVSHDIFPFMKKYRFYPEYMQPWPGIGHDEMRLIVTYRDHIAELASVVVRSFATYEQVVWPRERPCISIIAGNLNDYFGQRDVIVWWEEQTGLKYERPEFHPELCSAIKNGPNANAYAYDRVIFYHETPWDKLVELISHEIGTHVLFPVFREMQLSDKYDVEVLCHAMESLAMFYNGQLFGTTDLKYDLTECAGSEYVSFYTALHTRNTGLDARDLLKKGIEWVGK